MAYRLEPGEPVGDGLRRIAGEQLQEAVAGLRGATDASWDDSVHDVRKRCKRVRAVLRLARDRLGEDVYTRDNVAVRDAARRLSAVRDARVLVDALDDLAAHSRTDADRLAALRAALVARHDATRERVVHGASAPGHAAQALEAAARRAAAWPLPSAGARDGWDLVAPGLRRTYRRGRRRGAEAYADPTDERFHEFRKRVKDLWHHFEVLEVAWPPVLAVLADAAHELSGHLGEDHDLGVLVATVAADLPDAPGAADVPALVAGRRRECRAAAAVLRRRLYAETPGRFVDLLGAWWHAPPGEPAPAP